MSESAILASLDASSSEAGNEQPAGDQGSGAPSAGAPAQPAGNGGRDAAVHAPASGDGAGSDAGNSNAAEGAGNKLVPHGALHEAREQVKALRTQIAELEKRPWLSAEDAELLKELKAQRKAAAEPKAPEFLDDPKGYIDHKEKQFQDALKQLRESDTKRSESEQQQQHLSSLVTTIASAEQAFVATTPDYQEALQHTRSIRAQQLKLMFPQATDQQIQAQIGREELGGAQQILQAGGNPAEFAYNYAKTLGYMKKAPAAGLTNGAAAEAEAKPDKDAVRTLGGGGGAEPEGEAADPMPEFTAALKERFTRKRK